jgi:uncharacterized protein (TIGR00288 family)
LSPWWLRPTSEGAANEEREDNKEQNAAPPPARGEETVSGAAPSSAGAAEGEAGHEGHAGAEPPAAPRWPEELRPAAPEPYRSFWQPRPEAPAPAQETAASPVHPAPPAAPAAAWGPQAGLDFDRPAESRTPAAEGPGSGAGAFDTAHAAPSRVSPSDIAPAASGRREPQALHPASASSASLEPAAADLESEGEAEGEAEERDEGSAGRAEARKKRSRRSRGGRRKNGRIGAAAGAPEPADDDDEDLASDEPPQPFGQLAPAPAPPVMLTPRSARAGESYVISANDLDSMSREIVISVPDRQRPQHEERKIAVFCDFENIALGVRDSEISKFDIGLILERLLEKGKIIVKKAYADWERYSDYKRPFHEAAIELIDIPQKFYSGKNSADIKMVVDAMDLSYSKEHLDTFVILSGDSDFSPLVSKLKENNKYVIGIGVKNSSSNLLVDNCDEFIYYEDIWRDAQKGPKLDGLSKKTAEAFSLMVESIQALVRENKDVLWGSMIKQTMQRKKPSFNEGYYGYSTFSELLEDAERKNIVKLKKDQRSGTYIVTGFAKSGDAGSGRRQI